MTATEYQAKFAEHEAKLAEFEAKADMLEQAEHDLVLESLRDEIIRQRLIADYDAALAAKDQAGIAVYESSVEELAERYRKRHAALEAVRGEYDALARERPRPPRRTRAQLSAVARAITRSNMDRPSVLFSAMCFVASVATFFLVPWAWYWAILAAFGVWIASAAIRGALWYITGRNWP